MSEIISIHVGQAGAQVGYSIWELLTTEHNIAPSGKLLDTAVTSINDSYSIFFRHTESNQFVPRAVFVDLEPIVIETICESKYHNLFNPDFMITGKEDGANLYARGFYTKGTHIINKVTDCIRKQADSCDCLQGFLMYNSVSGGTGSGFAALLLHKLSTEYEKKVKMQLVVHPSPNMSNIIVEPYNTILATHGTLQHTNCAFVFDNEGLYSICNTLDVASPNYTNINRLVAQIVSCATSSLRFDGSLNVNLREIEMNLVPFARLHYPIMSYAPLVGSSEAAYTELSVSAITKACLDDKNRFSCCEMWRGSCMACCMMYRGDIVLKDIKDTFIKVQAKNNIKFVDWVPTGFKVGITRQPPRYVPGGDLANVPRAVCALINTTAMSESWANISRKFTIMFRKRAFIHWYLNEGMEESEFPEAQEDVDMLEEDYNEVSAGAYN